MKGIEGSLSTEAPVAYVGEYLKHLCEDSPVSDYFLFNRSQSNQLSEGEEFSPVSMH